MTFRNIFLLLAFMACSNLYAQNVTKAEIDELSQRVTKLEANLERVITENVNLVEQLNIKNVSSFTDPNQIKWDIVKVEPNAETNDVVLTFRITNNSGVVHDAGMGFTMGSAIDSDSNLGNNVYTIKSGSGSENLSALPSKVPINIQGIVKGVPLTSTYLAVVKLSYQGRYNKTQKAEIKFTGIHIPW